MRAVGKFTAPSFLHLYEGTTSSEVNVHKLAAFLGEQLPVSAIDVRADFLRFWLGRQGDGDDRRNGIARRLVQARVRQVEGGDLDLEPLPAEVDFERRFLTAGGRKPAGILYDGYQLLELYAELVRPDELSARHCHIVLTNQLFGSWDQNDRRYHARVSVYGFPSLISTAGLVEGPARPREFYLRRSLGIARSQLENGFNQRYLGHRDPRLQEAAKGYLLQAVFYHVTGDPFCDDKECRLFNAHWQEEMLHAQLNPHAGLCKLHRELLVSWTCR